MEDGRKCLICGMAVYLEYDEEKCIYIRNLECGCDEAKGLKKDIILDDVDEISGYCSCPACTSLRELRNIGREI